MIRIETDAVAALIGRAFSELDVTAWLITDSSVRTEVLSANFAILVEHAQEHGTIHVLPDAEGDPVAAAVWFHQTAPQPPPPQDYDERLAAACGQWTPRFRMLDEAFEAHHPHDVEHHHLAFLAVRRDARCGGLGSRLMDRHHEHLDRAGLPAYLEASSERVRDLYLRHGYRVVAGGPFILPEGGPPMWPMWREPA
ncbi:acetyltransferase (GNAT) family protein [Herbihabitans rhizosphaerae]|uniref:Acetyltransferase (GNAT) family protein n=1 Tax=Herbihabitans rhizosphaerae TaxID=1872711 RepID=A0A4Q7KCW7_9PSEU|nr:GNAT family N-acetyltransferase [Herbihabitans rhizosphaerae]RZS30536.1 acetyltransferase (GNAT) family protein [Herbihabitans rhizosphaerae]